MANLVTTDIQGDIATLKLDDGKANVLSLAMTIAINAALDQAEREARVVIIEGRPGILSAGFDLKLIQGDDAGAREAMRSAGFALFNRLLLHPQPLIVACTGHAVAGGAFLLLTSDRRIGTTGDFKIGLNEVAIGRPMPVAGVELTRARLSPTALTSALLLAELFSPEKAIAAGYLDSAVAAADLNAAALDAAHAYLSLDPAAFTATKRSLRQPIVERILSNATEAPKDP